MSVGVSKLMVYFADPFFYTFQTFIGLGQLFIAVTFFYHATHSGVGELGKEIL